MKHILVVVALFAACNIQAATVLTANWAAATDNGLGLSNGTPLAVGNEIRLGAFDFPDATLNSQVQGFISSGDLVGLAAHFTLFDTAFIGTSAFAGNLGTIPLSQRSGLFEKSSGGVSLAAGSPLFSKQMFMWAFKTSGDNGVLGNFSNVTQTGVFSSNTSAWFFPADTGNPESRPIEITNLSDSAGTALAATARIVSGGFGTSTVPLATAPSSGSDRVFTLTPVTPVPEPGAIGLLAVGSLAFAGRRRF